MRMSLLQLVVLNKLSDEPLSNIQEFADETVYFRSSISRCLQTLLHHGCVEVKEGTWTITRTGDLHLMNLITYYENLFDRGLSAYRTLLQSGVIKDEQTEIQTDRTAD